MIQVAMFSDAPAPVVTPPSAPKRAKGQTKRARVVVPATPIAPRLGFQAAAHARLTGVEARSLGAARALEAL